MFTVSVRRANGVCEPCCPHLLTEGRAIALAIMMNRHKRGSGNTYYISPILDC